MAQVAAPGMFVYASLILPEDKILPKIATALPVLGLIVGLFKERSLAKKITQTAIPNQLVYAINVKNHYKVASVVRNLLTATAIAVAIVALGVFGTPLAIPLFVAAGLHVLATGLIVGHICINKKNVNELQTTGVRPGMKIR